jgi:hypothetical protein
VLPLQASDTVRVKAWFGGQPAKVAPSSVSWFWGQLIA